MSGGWAVAVAVLTALGGLAGLVSLLTVRSTAKKLLAEGDKAEADAAQILSSTAIALLAPAKEQIKDLQEQLRTAQSEVQDLRNQVHQMTKEIGELRDENAKLRKNNPV